MYHEHRIAILKHTKGNIWLIILPLIRALVSLNFDIIYWLKNAYLDIIVILFILGTAWVKWRNLQYRVSKKGIYVKSGVLIKKEVEIPFSAISVVLCTQSVFLRPFGAVKIRITSQALSGQKSIKKKDIKLIVTDTIYSQIYQFMPIDIAQKKVDYQSTKKEILVFSSVFSSAFTGILYIIAFCFQVRKNSGMKDTVQLLTVTNNALNTLKKIIDGVTATGAVLVIIISVSFLLDVVIRILRYFNLRTEKTKDVILNESGRLSHWKYYVNISSVDYIDLQQNLLMKLCRIKSLYIGCGGYGNRRRKQPLLVPVVKENNVSIIIQKMFPDFTLSNITIRTKKTYLFAYIGVPIIITIAVPIISGILCKIFSEWRSVIIFFTIIFEFAALNFLTAKIVSKRITGIGMINNVLTLQYSNGCRFHTIIIPAKRVAYVKIRSTIFQRAGGCCDIIIYLKGECSNGHRVRGIMLNDAQKVVNYCT